MILTEGLSTCNLIIPDMGSYKQIDTRTEDQKTEDLKQLLQIRFRDFVKLCIEWKDETQPDLTELIPFECPIHGFALSKGRCLSVVGTTEQCPICGFAMCPDCGSHNVEQLSRVTGYMSGVSGWNASKRQEFLDRTHHNLTMV